MGNNLEKAKHGDINAFQEMFSEFQGELKSYLFRLTANRNDAEDFLHDAFIKSFDAMKTFKGDSSLKTWVFRIATNLAFNKLKRKKRWERDVLQKGKELAMTDEEVFDTILSVNQKAEDAVYEIREHIDTCFTCVSKTLPIENQITLFLKDVYGFSIFEIAEILEKSEGVIKHLLFDARKTLTEIFDKRCALVNKNGICNQCSELNKLFNPKQNTQIELMKIDLVKNSEKYDREKLFEMRTTLIREINPLKSDGRNLQEVLLNCNRMAIGETNNLKD